MSLSSLPPSWQADLAAARSGSMDALNRLFASVRPYLLKVAAGMLPDDLKARFDNEDLVQNTLLEAFVAFSSFRGSMSQEWLSWLLHILRHNAQDIDRRGHRSKRSPTREIHVDGSCTTLGFREDHAFTTNTPETILIQREERASVQRAVRELPDPLRWVMRLRFHHCFSCSEIARRLGRSENAVQLLAQRALERMRRRVNHHKEGILL